MNFKDLSLTNDDYTGLQLSCVEVNKLSYKDQRELLTLLNTDYKNMGMENVFNSCSSLNKLYVYRLFSGKRLVASRQLLVVKQNRSTPLWTKDISRMLDIDGYAIGSRAIVHPDYRNQGIGSYMVSSINQCAFADHNIDVVLGSSTSLGAIALYLRLGASMWRNDVNNLLFNNGEKQNQCYFSQLVKNKNLRLLRFAEPIRYLYHRNMTPSSWSDYLWSNELPDTVSTKLNDEIIAKPHWGRPSQYRGRNGNGVEPEQSNGIRPPIFHK